MTVPLDILLAIVVPYTLVLIWLVRLESRTLSNTRGVERSDDHHKEGATEKADISVLKNEMGHVKEDVKEIKELLKGEAVV